VSTPVPSSIEFTMRTEKCKLGKERLVLAENGTSSPRASTRIMPLQQPWKGATSSPETGDGKSASQVSTRLSKSSPPDFGVVSWLRWPGLWPWFVDDILEDDKQSPVKQRAHCESDLSSIARGSRFQKLP
jgi:hypothetical protein